MRRALKLFLAGPLLVGALAGSTAVAATIGFESIPGGLPSRGLAISNQFAATDGITFAMADGSNLLLGDYGPPADGGWFLDSGEADTLAPGYSGGGHWFVTVDASNFSPSTRYLVVSYSDGMAEVGFSLIDVDFGVTVGVNPPLPAPEGWTVRVYDAGNALLSSLTVRAGDPGTGDGVPTPVDIHAPAGTSIRRLEVQYLPPLGSTGDPGVGFDDFSSTPVPEPPTTVFGISLIGAAIAGSRSQRVD